MSLQYAGLFNHQHLAEMCLSDKLARQIAITMELLDQVNPYIDPNLGIYPIVGPNLEWDSAYSEQLLRDVVLDSLEAAVLSPQHAREYAGYPVALRDHMGCYHPFRIIKPDPNGPPIPIHYSEYIPELNWMMMSGLMERYFRAIEFTPTARTDSVIWAKHKTFYGHLQELTTIEYSFLKLDSNFDPVVIESGKNIVMAEFEELSPVHRRRFNPEIDDGPTPLKPLREWLLTQGRWSTFKEPYTAIKILKDGVVQGAILLTYTPTPDGHVYHVIDSLWRYNDENKKARVGGCLTALALKYVYEMGGAGLNIGIAFASYKQFWKGSEVNYPGFKFKDEPDESYS